MTKTIDLSILETLEYDDDGYMVDANAWTPEIGEAIASVLEIKLTDRHWDVINFARKEFAANGDAPSLRQISTSGGVPTRELYELFPGGPAKIAAKIAGLPKPTGCI
jgi:TusE/DsrC/DsvC family sulfur relay protein